ncbi:MAG TPA: hypothetical protein VGR02_23115, partial [Thermoanaerobaculia bacterium]|nr:hypothetical protein [Thermoanaerobaculia bacterium]
MPLILAAVAVLALGLAYYAAVKRNTAYLVGRDMRLLSAAAKQLNGTISSQRSLIKNFANADVWSDDKQQPLLHYERRALGDGPLARYFGDLDTLDRAPQTGTPPLTDEYTQTLISKNDQLIVELTYRAAKKPATRWPNDFPMQGDGPPSATGRLSLDKVVERVFASTLMASFDSVLLARENGSVLYQVQPVTAVRRAGLTRSAAPAPPAVVLTSLASLREEGAWRAETPISLEMLRTLSRQTDVSLGGVSYVLISQPYVFDTPLSTDGPKEKSASWILCGLVPKSRFRHEATALSASTLAIGTGAFLLLLCCGPFLKLALLGGQQPLKRSDVMLLTVTTLLGGSIVALFVVDFFAYQRLNDIADEEQRAYAAGLTATLRADVNHGLQVADELMLVTRGGKAEPDPGSFDNAAAKYSDRLPRSSLYPWASSFAWIGKEGMHYSRGEMGPGRPPMVKVSRREYFKRVQNEPLIWHGEGTGAGRPMYIDSSRALTTGKPETVFAVPTGNPQLPVFSVMMPFVQFASPVAPPGMSFAVIDDDGNVLYHQDEQRILIENVFTETDNNGE